MERLRRIHGIRQYRRQNVARNNNKKIQETSSLKLNNNLTTREKLLSFTIILLRYLASLTIIATLLYMSVILTYKLYMNGILTFKSVEIPKELARNTELTNVTPSKIHKINKFHAIQISALANK